MKSSEIIREKKFVISFLLLLFIGFLYIMKPFVMTMILAGIIVVIFYPLFEKLTEKIGGRKRLSSFIMTILILFIIIIPIGVIVTILANQIYDYVGALNIKQTFSEWFSTDFYVTRVMPFIAELEYKYDIKINFIGMLSNFSRRTAGFIGSYSPSVVLGTANFIFNFFIMLAGIFFLFIEGPTIIRIIYDLSPLRENYEFRLSKKIRDTIDASIYGYLVTGIFMAVISSLSYIIVGLNAYVILGTLTFFMSMVPFVGTLGVWIPVSLWLFAQGQTWQGVVVIVGGLIVGAVDYFVKPIIIKGRTEIHPLLIFFSLFGGISVFGLLGILFGPVITALLIAMITIYREEFI